jgi:hypothetical protein
VADVADSLTTAGPFVINVFGDESSDETHQRVFSVSGLIGTNDEWAEAETLWTQATRGEEFHAAEWEHAKRFDDYKAATQALISSHVAGVVMSMDLAAYRSVIPDQLPDAGYYACFTKLIAGMSREWHRWNERTIGDPQGGDMCLRSSFHPPEHDCRFCRRRIA